MAALCGTCTVWIFATAVLGSIAGGGHSISELITSIAGLLAIGGVPTAIGIALMRVGWRISQRAG